MKITDSMSHQIHRTNFVTTPVAKKSRSNFGLHTRSRNHGIGVGSNCAGALINYNSTRKRALYIAESSLNAIPDSQRSTSCTLHHFILINLSKMRSLKTEELSLRKMQLIERLRTWKSSGKKKSPQKSKTSPAGKMKENHAKENVAVAEFKDCDDNDGGANRETWRDEIEEQLKKEQAVKIIAVTQLVKERCEEDLNKAIYELHAQMFLNSIQRQHMEELESKAGTAIETLHLRHRRELAQANDAKDTYERNANHVVEQLNDQMNTLNELAMKRIAQLEQENKELKAAASCA